MTHLVREQLQRRTDLLLIINSTPDELLEIPTSMSMTMNDLNRGF